MSCLAWQLYEDNNPMNLFNFSDTEETRSWNAIDDRVMGGVSRSEMVSVVHDGQNMTAFRGEVSLRNNGGFASVRATLKKQIESEMEHISIACRNSDEYAGKTYYLNVRTNNGFDGLSYRTSFEPQTQLLSFDLPAPEFMPVFRGRNVPDAPSLILSDVRQLGLMIAEKQTGTFELLIASIQAF